MCGRFSLLTNVKAIIERFGIGEPEVRPQPRYNIAPAQMISVVVNGANRRLTSMKWGLVPSWARDEKIGQKLINARAETILAKPPFRVAIKKRRCFILADGFFEWQRIGKLKRPMYIRLKSREPFAFAGIYEIWKTPENRLIHSCAIITTTPNDILQPIHNRMPVILSRDNEKQWLDISIEKADEIVEMLKPYPSSEMEAYEVSTFVNSPSNTGSECIRPVSQSVLDRKGNSQ
ncbi:MAG: SOS response-associated peptidase [Candidatus Thorarchaeota archaeon]